MMQANLKNKIYSKISIFNEDYFVVCDIISKTNDNIHSATKFLNVFGVVKLQL